MRWKLGAASDGDTVSGRQQRQRFIRPRSELLPLQRVQRLIGGYRQRRPVHHHSESHSLSAAQPRMSIVDKIPVLYRV